MDYGCIERDEETGKAYWRNTGQFQDSTKRYPIADREKGAMKRLAKVMENYPTMKPYVQGDPRGASLFILREGDVPAGADVDGYYSRGIAVYK